MGKRGEEGRGGGERKGEEGERKGDGDGVQEKGGRSCRVRFGVVWGAEEVEGVCCFLNFSLHQNPVKRKFPSGIRFALSSCCLVFVVLRTVCAPLESYTGGHTAIHHMCRRVR